MRTIRAGARAPYARTARVRCTCSPYAGAVREPYARTVRKECAPKSAVFFSTSAAFCKSVAVFKICGNFLHVRSAVRYGARARTMCARARARARTVRAERARAVRTHRARARTVRTVREPYARTVRKKCALKSAVFFSKSAVFFFKICCVFFKICCVFFVRAVRAYGGRTARRARARRVRTCDSRARAKTARARTVRARCTVCANRTRGLCGKCVCQISLCCFQYLMRFFQNLLRFFFKSAVFFSHVRSAHTVVVRYGTRSCGAHVRAARMRARARCAAHARGVRVRSAQCACMARVRLMSVAQPARSAADAFEPSFRSLGLLCFLSNKKYPHSLTPM